MKLIDLLKIELPKRGGWPKGMIKCCQSISDSELYFYDDDDSDEIRFKFYPSCKTTTEERVNGYFYVTREEYEQAMSQPPGFHLPTHTIDGEKFQGNIYFRVSENVKHSAHSFLEKGVQHMKDRAAQRDIEGGERSMKACVDAFNAMFGHSLTETEGWQFMVLLKMARSRNKFNPDDYEDAAAYSGLAGEARSNEKK